MLQQLTERNEWKFFGVLPKADPGLAAAWWATLLLRGILPAAFAIAMGVLVGAVQRGDSLAGPLALAGTIFVLLQVLSPIHQAVSSNLGDRTAAWLYDRLTEACVRPPGMGHLEDPTLTSDLTVARDFDLGMTGPPLSISMDFIASLAEPSKGGIGADGFLRTPAVTFAVTTDAKRDQVVHRIATELAPAFYVMDLPRSGPIWHSRKLRVISMDRSERTLASEETMR